MDESVGSVVLLVGLAVGVDYSMFYLRRKMEERDAGRLSEDALEFAAATSGQAVLISGLTVMIAMAGNVLRRQHRVPVVRDRHDPGRRHRGARVAHRTPRGPLQARRQGREGPASRSSGACATATTASPASGAGSSTACSRRPVVSLVVAGSILAAPRSRRSACTPSTRAPGCRRDLEVMQAYDRIQAAFSSAGRSPRSWRSRPTTSPSPRSRPASTP